MDYSQITNIGTIALGVIIAGLPFLAFGAFLSVIIKNYISTEVILRFFGESYLRNLFGAVALGFIFPVCECGIIPFTKGLIHKGVKFSTIILILTLAPVINPITIASTWVAFPNNPEITYFRVLVALLIGIILSWVFKVYDKSNNLPLIDEKHSCCAIENSKSKLHFIFKDFFHDVIHIAPYLLIGSLIAGIIQTFVPREYMTEFFSNPLFAVLGLMLFAFILSVCSSVDAFVILPFAGFVPPLALLSFLNLGPILDFKNILLYKAYFDRKFVIVFAVLSLVIIGTLGYLFYIYA